MSDELKLKPCPFCGSDDLGMNGGSEYVFCRGCGAEGAWNDDNVEEAIAAWNRRAPCACDIEAARTTKMIEEGWGQ